MRKFMSFISIIYLSLISSMCFAQTAQWQSIFISIFLLLPLYMMKFWYNSIHLGKINPLYVRYNFIKDVITIVIFFIATYLLPNKLFLFIFCLSICLIWDFIFYWIINKEKSHILRKKTIYIIINFLITFFFFYICTNF